MSLDWLWFWLNDCIVLGKKKANFLIQFEVEFVFNQKNIGVSSRIQVIYIEF